MADQVYHAMLAQTCPNCATVNVTMDVLAASPHAQDPYRYSVFCVCRNCGLSCICIVRSRFTNNYPLSRELSGSMLNGAYDIAVAPPIIPAAEAAPDHVPDEIATIFEEAASCEAIGCYDAAGAMFRKVLDASTRKLIGIEPQSVDRSDANYISFKQAKDLRLRLDWLFERGRLPHGLAELASCVHQDGNDAAHSLSPIGAHAAADLHDFTVAILEMLFTTPGRIAANIERREARRNDAK